MKKSKSFFKGLKKGLQAFGELITLLVNSLVLLLTYLLGFGISALLTRPFGKHFLDIKIEKDKKSYWIDYPKTEVEVVDYLKQY